MLNPLKSELKDAAHIRRKREVEEERKKRLLNPRVRMFGVDVEAWKQQSLEKDQAKQQEEQLEKAYHAQKVREDIICVAQDMRIDSERKDIMQKVGEFRKNCQRYEDRREFDLNDPLYLKRSLPPRLYDDDPRCTISSAQKFDGEDLQKEERERIQGEQIRAWLQQQMEEKKHDDWEKHRAEQIFQECLIARDKRALELAKMESDCIKRLQETTAQYNKSLAEERCLKSKTVKLKEDMDKAAEKYNWLTSDLLTENPDVAASNLGPNRVVGFLYKGEPPEKAYEIRKFQEQQIQERKIRQMQEEYTEKEWDNLKDRMRKQVYFKDKEIMKQQRELNSQMVEMNKKLAQEKRQRDEYFNKVVNTNVPTEAFYDQFNRSIY